MNAHISDKHRLSATIDAVCADLQALKARMYPASINSLEAQVESFECYHDYALDIIGFTNDLRVEAVTIAAALGNQSLSRADDEAIRATDAIDDIFTDCKSWCDEVRDELEAGE